MSSFWQNLPKPFFVQAPMENVTDLCFREVLFSAGKPDVFFTEFTNTDGLLSKGSDKTSIRLRYTENQRPIVAQIWGNKPEYFYQAAQKIAEMGFDGLDINMGCPDRQIIKGGSCAALINNPSLAANIFNACRMGAPSLPVSIKTRIGFHKIATEEWIGFLLQLKPSVLTIHARTAKEMSLVPAHWDEVLKAVQMRKQISKKTLIIGNGDVQSLAEGKEKALRFGADGVMIGRGILRNLWIFRPNFNLEQITIRQKLEALNYHLDLILKNYQEFKFEPFKKFYKVYLNGFPGASDLRMKFMEFTTPQEAIQELENLLKKM